MAFPGVLIGLLPSFLLVGLGGLIRARLSQKAWAGLDRLNFEILFPALLFVAASTREIRLGAIATIAPVVWGLMALALVVAWRARRFGPDRFLDFAGAWQTAWRFNSALAFIAVGVSDAADPALMAVVIGMAVPMANVFAVSALSRGGSLGVWGTLRRVALNPFLLASLAGVGVGLSGRAIPAPVLAPLEMLAAAAIPIALISVGATMNWGALARLDRFSGIICATKLVVVPAAAVGLCLVLGLPGAMAVVVVIWAALPTASGAHILAAGFGADRVVSATLVAQTTLLSAVTLPVWIALAALVFGG
ncbi:AEC family transporter [Thiosulfatihalobacter marinus]|uniref:AEC family transporter n=1 Tax=Thiosulfatihalobacter marinus TaxID=2792481 RepID=UPI001E314304|nr:AEC family transporter [Thiosulfatihalobacter marinus]